MKMISISNLQNGKYRIESLLGSGGFGNTYLATQVALGRKVAIKEFYMKEFCERDEATSRVVIPTEGGRQIVDRYKQKFLKEAQMIASLKNEHIIQIHDIFEENNTAYYVMEYVGGGSLKDIVESEGAFPGDVAIKYINQIADALSYLHAHNILHLDVKPANILLDNDGCAILIDFGISKHYDAEGGQTSTTPSGISRGYAPIEQYQQGSVANFNPATDVYSLGATLLYLVTGITPPDAMEVTNEGLNETDMIHLSSCVRDAIVISMQARRKDRPQTIQEFQKYLIQEGHECDKKVDVSEETVVVTSFGLSKKGDAATSKTKRYKLLIVLSLIGVVAVALSVWIATHPFHSQSLGLPPSSYEAVMEETQSAGDEPQAVENDSVIVRGHRTPSSSFLDLGYGKWSGDTKNRKPHGQGVVYFSTTRSFNGVEVRDGYRLEAQFNDGVLVIGQLYDSEDNLLKTIMP